MNDPDEKTGFDKTKPEAENAIEKICSRCDRKFYIRADSKVYTDPENAKWCPDCISQSFEGVYDNPIIRPPGK